VKRIQFHCPMQFATEYSKKALLALDKTDTMVFSVMARVSKTAFRLKEARVVMSATRRATETATDVISRVHGRRRPPALTEG
jgi:hypothetical protein